MVEKLRNERVIRDDPEGLGRWALSFPKTHIPRLAARWPDLFSPDPATLYRATVRFLDSPESAPYRVHHKRRGRQ